MRDYWGRELPLVGESVLAQDIRPGDELLLLDVGGNSIGVRTYYPVTEVRTLRYPDGRIAYSINHAAGVDCPFHGETYTRLSKKA